MPRQRREHCSQTGVYTRRTSLWQPENNITELHRWLILFKYSCMLTRENSTHIETTSRHSVESKITAHSTGFIANYYNTSFVFCLKSVTTHWCRANHRRIAGHNFECIFLIVKCCTLIAIPLNEQRLVQLMASASIGRKAIAWSNDESV